MKTFAHSSWPTYITLVVEFLSSLLLDRRGKAKTNDHINGIHFRLNGVEYYQPLSWVNEVFGFRTSGEQFSMPELERDIGPFYYSLTGRDFVEFRNSKVSFLHNPIFHYLQRFFACTIFCRHESTGNLRKNELMLLWAMTRRKSVKINLAAHMVRHWYNHATKDSSKIMFGGLINPIALALNYNFGQQQPVQIPPFTTIDLPYLLSTAKYSKEQTSEGPVYYLYFSYNPKKTLRLPSHLCDVTDPELWLFPSLGLCFPPRMIDLGDGRIGPDPEAAHDAQLEALEGAQEETQEAQSKEQPESSSRAAKRSRPHMYPRQYDHTMMARMNAVEAEQTEQRLKMDQMYSMVQQIYDWHVSQGHFQPTPPPDQ